jgi:hypothetical protein
MRPELSLCSAAVAGAPRCGWCSVAQRDPGRTSRGLHSNQQIRPRSLWLRREDRLGHSMCDVIACFVQQQRERLRRGWGSTVARHCSVAHRPSGKRSATSESRWRQRADAGSSRQAGRAFRMLLRMRLRDGRKTAGAKHSPVQARVLDKVKHGHVSLVLGH